MKKLLIKKLNAFTLVELIIVITILAILATIAFVSFQNYTKDARDSNRTATIAQLEKGLEVYSIKTGSYPNPEELYASGYINTNDVIFEVWYIKDNISRNINFSKTPIDPVSGDNYVYWVSYDKKYYQIATTLENLETNIIIPITYANSYQAYVVWIYKWVLKKWDTLVNPPSLILAEKWAKNLTGSTHYFVEDKSQNLPYKLNATTPLTGSIAKPTTSTGLNNLKNDWNTLSGSIELVFSWISKDTVWTIIFWEKEYFTSLKDWWSSGWWETPPVPPFPTICWNWTSITYQQAQDNKSTIMSNISNYIWCEIISYPWTSIPWWGVYIAWITQDKWSAQYIMVIAKQNILWTKQWWCYWVDISLSTNITFSSTLDWDGMANTTSFLAQCSELDRAPKICRDIWTNWYLPAKNELTTIYTSKSSLWTFTDSYWSSTEASNNLVWYVYFINAAQYDYYKFVDHSVRCVSRF